MLKIVGVTFLGFLTVGASALVGGGVYVASGGVGSVEVDTPEVHFILPVPMRLAEVGLSVAEQSMPRHELEQLRREAGQFAPLVEAALKVVAEVPDGTVLVSVETPQETVRIAREGGKIVIDVDSPDAEVHVRVPARAIRNLGDDLGDFLSG